MDDLSRLEASMANIERLTQRLVILFELQLEKKLNKLEKNLEASARPLDQAAANAKKATEATEAVAENLDTVAANVTKAKKSTEKLNTGSNKLAGLFKSFVHEFNQAVDGANTVSAATRQMLGTVNSLTSTVINSLAKLEPSSAQAAAASNGMLTTAQWLSKSAGYFSTVTRNVTQFGLAAGGTLSAVEIMTDIMAIQRRKLEVRVADAKRLSDIELAGRVDYRAVSQTGLSTAQIEKDEREKEQARRKLLAESVLRRKQAAAPKIVAANTSGMTLLSQGTPMTLEEKRQLQADEIEANLNEQERKSIEERIKVLQKQIDTEAKRVAVLTPLQQLNDKLTEKLFEAKIGAAKRDYDAELKAISLAHEGQFSLLGTGNDEAVLTSLIELTKQAQEVAIAREQQKYDDAIYALNANPLRDSEGNVLKDVMLKEQSKLLESFTSNLEKLATTFGIDANRELTPAARLKLQSAAKNINSGLNTALAKNQASSASLSQAAKLSPVDAQALVFAKQSRDSLAATANAAALARPGLFYDAIDPLAVVEIKLAKLKQDMADYEAQRKEAIGNNAAIIDENITATRLAIESIESTDVILAQRANRATELRVYIEKLERGILQANSNSEVAGAKRNELLERRKRQLATAGDAPGSSGLISIQMQDEELARQRTAAQLRINMLSEQYSLAVKNNESEASVLALKNSLMDATATQIKLLNDQALTVAKQNSMLEYQLEGDKSAFSRFGKSKLLGSRTPAWMQRLTSQSDLGFGLGSESARLTSDFNESWRRRYGKLTPEEKAAAKEERKMNNQLERAREAIANGGGTRKQRELVRLYDEQKDSGAENKLARLVELSVEANKALNMMAGIAKP